MEIGIPFKDLVNKPLLFKISVNINGIKKELSLKEFEEYLLTLEK
jgi:hypothetical protein